MLRSGARGGARRLRRRRRARPPRRARGRPRHRRPRSRTTTATSSAGLRRAVDAGIRVWVPPVEAELIAERRRPLAAPAARQRLRPAGGSLLAARVGAGQRARSPSTGRRAYGGIDVYTLPTPGHTIGSVTYLVELDGRRARLHRRPRLRRRKGLVARGDAVVVQRRRGPGGDDRLLRASSPSGSRTCCCPSHGEPIDDPPARARARRARGSRSSSTCGAGSRGTSRTGCAQPFEAVTPHLLRNRTMLREQLRARSRRPAPRCCIDFGYDLTTGTPAPSARAAAAALVARRAAPRPRVERIEAVVPTHYHDDHVAGLNLLRDVEGAEVWAPENVAPVLEEPTRYDLPCLWFEPIRVDRALPLGEPFAGTSTSSRVAPAAGSHALRGGDRVRGRRPARARDRRPAVERRRPRVLNYQYRNRFQPGRLRRRAPSSTASCGRTLIISGHWLPHEVDDGYLDSSLADGRRLEELHAELLPDEGFGERRLRRADRAVPRRRSARGGDGRRSR